MKVTVTYKHLNPFADEAIATIKRSSDVPTSLTQDRIFDLAREVVPEGYYLRKVEYPDYTVEYNEDGEQC